MSNNTNQEELLKKYQSYDKQIYYIMFYQCGAILFFLLIFYFLGFETLSQADSFIYKSEFNLIFAIIIAIFVGILHPYWWYKIWQQNNIKQELGDNAPNYSRKSRGYVFWFLLILLLVIFVISNFNKELINSIILWIFLDILFWLWVIIIFSLNKRKYYHAE